MQLGSVSDSGSVRMIPLVRAVYGAPQLVDLTENGIDVDHPPTYSHSVTYEHLVCPHVLVSGNSVWPQSLTTTVRWGARQR
jgi:hypothetical protein